MELEDWFNEDGIAKGGKYDNYQFVLTRKRKSHWSEDCFKFN